MTEDAASRRETLCRRGLWAFVVGYTVFLPFSISGTQACLAGMIACRAGSWIAARRIDWRREPLLLPMAVFLGWIAVSTAFSVDPARSVTKSLEAYWILPAYFLVLHEIDADDRRVLTLFKVLAVVSGVVAIYGIAQAFFGWDALRVGGNDPRLFNKGFGYFHATGFFDHHLTYGNSLMMSLFANVALFFSPISRRWKMALVPLTALALVAFFFTYARGPLLGFVFGCVIYGYVKGRKYLLIFAAASIALIAAVAYASPTFRDRVQSSFTSNQNVERIVMWQTTVEMIKDHPWTGSGPSTYRKTILGYRTGYNVSFTSSAHAHNFYLQTAATCGIPAMLALIWLFARLFACGVASVYHSPPERKVYRETVLASLGAMAAFCFAGIFQNNFGDAEVAMLMWLFAATVLRRPESAEDPT